MPGRGTPAGDAYPECTEAGRAGQERHKREGTVTCSFCRAKARAAMAEYRKKRIIQGRQLVSAVGTQRRIRALVTIGWSRRRIGEQLGVTGWAVCQILDARYVRRGRAEEVARLYRRLVDTPGPDRREARRALAAGWPGPMDWDDIDRQEDVVPGRVIEQAHAEALEIDRAYRKMAAKRARRAQMSEADRLAAREAQQRRRQQQSARVVA